METVIITLYALVSGLSVDANQSQDMRDQCTTLKTNMETAFEFLAPPPGE